MNVKKYENVNYTNIPSLDEVIDMISLKKERESLYEKIKDLSDHVNHIEAQKVMEVEALQRHNVALKDLVNIQQGIEVRKLFIQESYISHNTNKTALLGIGIDFAP